jgi:hypothetical protein
MCTINTITCASTSANTSFHNDRLCLLQPRLVNSLGQQLPRSTQVEMVATRSTTTANNTALLAGPFIPHTSTHTSTSTLLFRLLVLLVLLVLLALFVLLKLLLPPPLLFIPLLFCRRQATLVPPRFNRRKQHVHHSRHFRGFLLLFAILHRLIVAAWPQQQAHKLPEEHHRIVLFLQRCHPRVLLLLLLPLLLLLMLLKLFLKLSAH